MKRFFQQFQKSMMAATFAEAGEWKTAREMIPETRRNREITWLDKIFSAITFAEAGLHGDAIRFLDSGDTGSSSIPRGLEGLGLPGVHMVFGTVSVEA